MTKPSKSPDRHSFQKTGYLKRCVENGEEPNKDYLDMFQKIVDNDMSKWDNPNSRENNLEWYLLSTDWILEKARTSDAYSQNLYAALCNNDFIKADIDDTAENIFTVLKDGLPKWNCSWRYAGGIIADMRGEGDYIDWYCSGIRGGMDLDESDLTDEARQRMKELEQYVGEGHITDEIQSDLKKLGWVAVEDPDGA